MFLNCSCFHHINYTLQHCHKSFGLVFKNTCSTVLIFFSAHSVFRLQKKNLQGNATCNDVMYCVFQYKLSVTFESEFEPQLFVACS